ncbi:MAG: hypothetical protein WKF63_00740, partial [Thermomicrobiales bacterium]
MRSLKWDVRAVKVLTVAEWQQLILAPRIAFTPTPGSFAGGGKGFDDASLTYLDPRGMGAEPP